MFEQRQTEINALNMLQQMAKIGEYAESIDEISDSPCVGDETLNSRL